MYNLDYKEIYLRARKMLMIKCIPFLVFVLAIIFIIFLGDGYDVNSQTGEICMQKNKYLLNMIQLPYIGIMFIIGVVIVVFCILKTAYSKTAKHTFWINSIGVLLTVLSLFLCVGFNNTSYYPSSTNLQSSLTITNSSSSLFTLEVMSIVSLLIPVILIYVTIVWRAMDKAKITT